jgi:hypothetical protein
MIIDKFPTYITPTMDTFTLQRTIVAMNAVMLSTTCLPMQSNVGTLALLGWQLPMYYTFMSLWILLFQEEQWVGSCLCIVIALLLSMLLYLGLRVGLRRPGLTTGERFMVHIPMSVNLAWTSYLLMLTIGVYLKATDWYGFGLHHELALFLILVYVALAFALLMTRNDPVYGALVVMILLNIAGAHWPEVLAIPDVSVIEQGDHT